MRVTALIVASCLVACGGSDPVWEVDGRRDLLLDGERVELMEGFGDVTALRVLGDLPRVNQARATVIVPMPRNGRLRWHVDARPGHFLSGVTRLRFGAEEDASPSRLTVTALRDGVPIGEAVVPVPAVAAGEPAGALREGPAADVVLELPEGAEVLQIVFTSEGDPALGYLAMLSPRVEHEPRRVTPDEHPLRFEQELRLASLLTRDASESIVFATANNAHVQDEPVTVERVEFLGSFEGRIGRRALVLTGESRAELVVDIPEGAVLRGDLALDDRLPLDTRARLTVSVDGEEVASQEIGRGDWLPWSLPLGDRAGQRRRLAFSLAATHHVPAPVVKIAHDYDLQIEDLPTGYLAHHVRLGIADPRLAAPVERRRRVASADQPSVLLLHVETLRADLLPGFGGELDDLAPNLARLAACATAYPTAIAPSPWTLPSTATLLTGLPPSAHRATRHDLSVLPDEVPTLAELAREQGIAAGAIVTNVLLRSDAGFGRGFDPYVLLPHHNARQVNDLVQAFLSGHAGQQSLLFAHYYDPHHPFEAPAPWRDRYVSPELVGLDDRLAERRVKSRLVVGEEVPADDPDIRFLRQRYLGEIAWFDEQLGELLAFLDHSGLAETTAVVLTADHGEEFLEHGLLGHGSHLFDETLRVPLLVAGAGALVGWADGTEGGSGSEVASVVGTGGLFADVLTRLGVPFDAVHVLPGLAQTSADRPVAFAETEKGLVPGTRGDPLRRSLRAVRTDDHLLVWYLPLPDEGDEGWMCFYDLAADPGATRPLDADSREARWLRDQLEQAMRWSREHAAEVPTAVLDETLREQLEAMGYLSPGGIDQIPCADG